MVGRIANGEQLRGAYMLIGALKKSTGYDTSELVRELKQEIRQYNKTKQDRPVIVKDDGIDGYVSLEKLDECTDGLEQKQAEKWFEENRAIRNAPSAYDCTGRAFTMCYKVVRRRGHWYAYHTSLENISVNTQAIR